jgi:hypothetical protein
MFLFLVWSVTFVAANFHKFTAPSAFISGMLNMAEAIRFAASVFFANR